MTPYGNAWIVRVRVIKKTPIHTYSNSKNSGKLFTFEICDDDGNEMRITAFNEECDRFFSLIEEGKVYLFAKGEVKPANRQYNKLNSDYEIILNKNSIIELESPQIPLPKKRQSPPEFNSSPKIPKIPFKFTPIIELADKPDKTVFDVIGVIRSIGLLESVTSRRMGKELIKRAVNLVDKSMAEIQITLWHKNAREFQGHVGQVMAIKRGMINDFNGKSLSISMSSIVKLEPDDDEIPETVALRRWWSMFNNQQRPEFTCLTQESGESSSDNRFIYEINSNNIAESGNTYFNITGYLEATNKLSNQLYKACGFNGCVKKVFREEGEEKENVHSLYRCIKCNRTSPTFEWAIMMSIKLVDVTGSVWITLFHENVERLLMNKSVKQLAEIYQADEQEYKRLVDLARYRQYHIRAAARIDNYGSAESGECRIRVTGYQLKPVLQLQEANGSSSTTVGRSKKLFQVIDSLITSLIH